MGGRRRSSPRAATAHTREGPLHGQEGDADAYVAAILQRFGRIDGFFNNAGIEGRQNLTEGFTTAEFDRVCAINLRGVFLDLEKVLKVMHQQGSGYVVNTAGVGGIRGVGNQSGYAAAKHGVVGLTRDSAIGYGRHGIRINAIAPGAIWTPVVENSMRQLNAESTPLSSRSTVASPPSTEPSTRPRTGPEIRSAAG